MLVLAVLAGLHRTVQLQLLQHYWLGIDLDYCDIEWFALEMNRDHFRISELKWTGMGEFNSDDYYIYYCGQESLRRNGVAIMVNKRV